MELAIKNVRTGLKIRVGWTSGNTAVNKGLIFLDLRISLHLDSATDPSMLLLSGKNFSFENMKK